MDLSGSIHKPTIRVMGDVMGDVIVRHKHLKHSTWECDRGEGGQQSSNLRDVIYERPHMGISYNNTGLQNET